MSHLGNHTHRGGRDWEGKEREEKRMRGREGVRDWRCSHVAQDRFNTLFSSTFKPGISCFRVSEVYQSNVAAWTHVIKVAISGLQILSKNLSQGSDSTEIKSHALQNLFKIMLGKPRMKNTKGSARSVTRREAEARAVRSVNRHEAKAGGLWISGQPSWTTPWKPEYIVWEKF